MMVKMMGKIMIIIAIAIIVKVLLPISIITSMQESINVNNSRYKNNKFKIK